MMFLPPLELRESTRKALAALLDALYLVDLVKAAVANCPPGLAPHFVVDRRGRQMSVCARAPSADATPGEASPGPAAIAGKPSMLWAAGADPHPRGDSSHPALAGLYPGATHILRMNDHQGRSHYLAVGARGTEHRPGRGDRGGVYVVSARASLLSPEGKTIGRERLSNVYDPALWDKDADLAVAPIHPDSFSQGHTPEEAWHHATQKHKEMADRPTFPQSGGMVHTIRDQKGDTFGWLRRDAHGRHWLDRAEPNYRQRERADESPIAPRGGGGHLLPNAEAAHHLLKEENRPVVWQEHNRQGQPVATVSTFHYPMDGAPVKHAMVRLHPEAGYGASFDELKSQPVATRSGAPEKVDRWLGTYLRKLKAQAFGHEDDRPPAAPLPELLARHKTLNDLFASGDLGHVNVARRYAGVKRQIVEARKPGVPDEDGKLTPLDDAGLEPIWQRFQAEHPRTVASVRQTLARQYPHLFVGETDRPARAEERGPDREGLRSGYPTIDDTELEGVIADSVKEAAHRYDRRMGVPFSAYAKKQALGHAYRRIHELLGRSDAKDGRRIRILRDDVFGTDTPTKNFLRRRGAFAQVLGQTFPDVTDDKEKTHANRQARAVLAAVWPTGHFTAYRGDEALTRYHHAAQALAGEGIHLPPVKDSLELLNVARSHQRQVSQDRGSPYAAYHTAHLAKPLAELQELEQRQARANVVAAGKKRPPPSEEADDRDADTGTSDDLPSSETEPDDAEGPEPPSANEPEPEPEHKEGPFAFLAPEHQRVMEALYPTGDLSTPRFDTPEVRALGLPRAKLELHYGPHSAIAWEARRELGKALPIVPALERFVRAFADEGTRRDLRAERPRSIAPPARAIACGGERR